MSVLTIIYNNGVETNRWLHFSLATTPNPYEHPVGAVMVQRLGKAPPQWSQRILQPPAWATIEESAVPKVYRLLYLLE